MYHLTYDSMDDFGQTNTQKSSVLDMQQFSSVKKLDMQICVVISVQTAALTFASSLLMTGNVILTFGEFEHLYAKFHVTKARLEQNC